MKQLTLKGIIIGLSIIILSSCGSGYQGNLKGVLNRPSWYNFIPFGTVYIPSGSFHTGPSDQDVGRALMTRARQISVHAMFVDDTEISNNEYRQFVEYVKDSIAHELIGDDHIVKEGEYYEHIDWKKKIRWEREETAEILEEMYLPEDERYRKYKELDARKLNYEYTWIDYRDAAHNNSRIQKLMPIKQRTEVIKSKVLNIYPDTLVWVRDFTYSYNEPWTRHYFWHPAFDDYPVVGINWHQATAFSHWRSWYMNEYRRNSGDLIVDYFRLPTEFEWERAARGAKDLQPYPWGGPYVRNERGCILENFKPGRGEYPDDGGFYTVRIDAYWPNGWGLYNMAGNVAEWTSNAFAENANSFQHDLNSDYLYDAKEDDPLTLKRKIIRGGSWKDIAFYTQTSTRAYEYQDTSKSYVGFRNVMTFLGRSIYDTY